MNTYKVLKDCFIKRVLHKKGQEIKLSEQEAKQYVERRVLEAASKATKTTKK